MFRKFGIPSRICCHTLSLITYTIAVFICQLLEESEQDTDPYSKESLPQYTDRGVPIARVEDYVTDRDTHSTDSVSFQLFTHMAS